MSNPAHTPKNMRFSSSKAELLKLLLRKEEGVTATKPDEISQREDTTSFPLSCAQEHLWHLEGLEFAQSRHIVSTAWHLAGALDINILQKSLQSIVSRHETLQASFANDHERPAQHITQQTSLQWSVTDLRPIGHTKHHPETAKLLRETAEKPFDLAHSPLLRATLFQIDDIEYILLLSTHLIVADRQSHIVLGKELSALYSALITETASALSALPIQYADFALWQRQRLQSEALRPQLSYWQQHLQGAPALLTLPTDHPRPPIQRFLGSSFDFSLSHELMQQVQEFSQQQQVTPFMVLLAAFQLLLARYSGLDDLAVGTPIANRMQEELEPLIGFFVNTLVLRLDLSGDPDGYTLLERVREMALQAYAHQDVPFEQVVEALQPERDLSYNPLAQVFFAFEPTIPAALALPGVQSSLWPLERHTSMFDLTLFLQQEAVGVSGTIEYNRELFEPATIARLSAQYLVLLEALLRHPEQNIWHLPLLPASEWLLLQQWNATEHDIPPYQSFHQLFEAQVQRTPEAIALIFADEQLTYQALDQRANQLAHYLQQLGVGPEVLVGLCMERSLDLVVALLAILKAGGAYVPLDPSYPQERLAFLFADAQLSLLVTHTSLLERLPPHTLPLLCLDEDVFRTQPISAPTSGMSAQNLAYVIYTSGSTGKPKGVMLTHQGLLNLTGATRAALDLQASDRVLQFASLSFDASIWEIVMAFSVGATLCLGSREALLPGTNLLDLCRDLHITTALLSPSVLATLPVVELPALRILIAGGEACSAEIVAKWGSQRRFFNAYGPTETTVCASIALCEPDGQPPSIGRPLANEQIYVLDAHLQPTPIGVPGELYLAGIDLARGYLQRPALTAERFLPHPWSEEPGARLYKTGDQARYRSDGTLEYLGRLDQQVKLRGFRIELEEIASVLRQHPAVQEAVVLLREERSGFPELVAYLVAPPQEAHDLPALLRPWLQRQLPDYMLPASFVLLDVLPLTSNGKLDRAALPRPRKERLELERSYQAPRTQMEQALVSLWADLLGIARIGIHDSFFSLGGHSLLAIQVLARIRNVFQVELPIRFLFEHPTIAALASQIVAEQSSRRTDDGLPPLQPVARDQELPLSFAQQRLWFLDRLEPGKATYNVSVAWSLQGPLNVTALQWSLQQILLRHEVLRTNFVLVEEYPVLRIHANLALAFHLLDLHNAEPQTLQRHLLQETQRPFDLSHDPLLRTCLFRLDSEDFLLLLTLHHIVTDGWSQSTLLHELSALYSASVTGTASALSALPIQYADFALWQRQRLQSEALRPQLSYWQQHLQGAPALLTLPTDHPRPPIQRFLGSSFDFSLSHELMQQVQEFSQQQQVTPFMVLLAAFQLLLARYSGLDDLAVGTPIANRMQEELEPLIGFFVNTLVLRLDLSGDPDGYTLLERVREMALQAYAHQDVPFEQVVEALQPERDLSYNPLIQVLFAFEPTIPAALALPGVQSSLWPLESHTSMFDLTLFLQQEAPGVSGIIEYNRELFEPATIARLSAQYLVLLEALLRHPEQNIWHLPLLPASEWLLLQQWNATEHDIPPYQSFHQLFEAQAQRTPEAIAVIYGHDRLTYRLLNERANQLAHRLQSCGIKPECLVGICLPRSFDLLVALLAIIKAGGGYLPLDPSYPQDRLSFMLSDAHVDLLLTQQDLLHHLPCNGHLPLLCIDREAMALTELPRTNLPVVGSPEQVSYVIYTSGSTGRPKGVCITHSSTLTLLHWAHERFSQAELAGVLASTSICFDLSVFELFVPLSWGGSVILAEDALAWTTLPAASEITLLNTVPSVATALLRSEQLPPNLHTINLAGEPLRRELVEQLFTHSSATRIYNLYGPTEDTTYSTCQLLTPQEEGVVGLGRSISNTRLYLLDAHLQPVPLGVVGELYLAGAGLARGYLHQPASTAERFVPDPFSSKDGQRLYRTGDLARYHSDGTLEYLGRLDQQVKLRGFRIELEEIASVLRQHPAVQEAVVLLREERSGFPELVAYLVAPLQQTHDLPALLRPWLQRQLPDYMLPASFVLLDILPLTANGKLDRAALPHPGKEREQLGTSYQAPRTQMEQALVSLWADLLGIAHIGIHDSFFSLGGHSLLVIQVLARIRNVFQVELPIRFLFEHPTIAALAQQIVTEQSSRRTDDGLPPLQPVARDQELPLSFAQQRFWLLDRLEPGTAAYNVPLPLHLVGDFNLEYCRQSLYEIIRRHEILRTNFVTIQGKPFQRISSNPDMSLKIIDLRYLCGAEQEQMAQHYIEAEVDSSFNLAEEPLLRTLIIQLSNTEHILLVNIHHIVLDGWSGRIFLREFCELYNAFVTNRPSSLPMLPIQYADFAAWQQQWLQQGGQEQQLTYWKQQLSAAPDLALPVDLPPPTHPTARLAAYPITFSSDLSSTLRQLSQQKEVTLFMTLLAAFQALLSCWTNQQDIVVGTLVANRRRIEVEALIGCFVNTLALRTHLDGNPTFEELLKRVQEGTLEAYSHQDVPVELVINTIRPTRQPTQTSLFRAMFVLHKDPLSLINLVGLTATPLEARSKTARVDLMMSLVENQEDIKGVLEYNGDLFSENTIARMALHYTELVKAVSSHPELRIKELASLLQQKSVEVSPGSKNGLSILVGENGVQGRQPLPEREVSSQPSFSKIPHKDGEPKNACEQDEIGRLYTGKDLSG